MNSGLMTINSVKNYSKYVRLLLYKAIIEEDVLMKDLLTDDKKLEMFKLFSYKKINNTEQQKNGDDCGVFTLRRMYILSKGLQEKDLPPVNQFRLFVLEQLVLRQKAIHPRLYQPTIGTAEHLKRTSTKYVPDTAKSSDLRDMIDQKLKSVLPMKLLTSSVETVKKDCNPNDVQDYDSDDSCFYNFQLETLKDMEYLRKDPNHSDESESFFVHELEALEEDSDESESFFVHELEDLNSESEKDNFKMNTFGLDSISGLDSIDSISDTKLYPSDDDEVEYSYLVEEELETSKRRIQIKAPPNISAGKSSLSKPKPKKPRLTIGPSKENTKMMQYERLLRSSTKSDQEKAKAIPKQIKKKLEDRLKSSQHKTVYDELSDFDMSEWTDKDRDKKRVPPLENEIDMLNENDYEQLIKKKKDNLKKLKLKKAQIDQWEKYSFDASQESIQAAQHAMAKFLNDSFKTAQKEYNKIHAKYKKQVNKSKTSKETLLMREEYVQKKVKLDLKKWEKKNLPIFHPRDSIYALQSREILIKNKLVKKYFAAVKQDNGTQMVKEVSYSWLVKNLEKEYIEFFQKHEEEKGWLCLGEDGPTYYIYDEKTVKLLKELDAIYEYKSTESEQLVTFVKAMAVFKDEISLHPQVECVNWFIKTSDSRDYFSFTEEEMKTLVTEDRFRDMLNTVVVTTIDDIKKLESGKSLNERYMDKKDENYRPEFIGDRESPQFYYWNMAESFPGLQFTFPTSKSQISKVKFCLLKKSTLVYKSKTRKLLNYTKIGLRKHLLKHLLMLCMNML